MLTFYEKPAMSKNRLHVPSWIRLVIVFKIFIFILFWIIVFILIIIIIFCRFVIIFLILGDEAASFTKEEMQQGKHQEFEKKLQDLYLGSGAQNGTPVCILTPEKPM